MGYYTEYEIYASDEVIAWMEENIDGMGGGERIEATGKPPVIYSKWYSWKNDLLSVSAHFPDEVIKVRGTGEESGDIWLVRFNNGAVIYEQKFDWSMLGDSDE